MSWRKNPTRYEAVQELHEDRARVGNVLENGPGDDEVELLVRQRLGCSSLRQGHSRVIRLGQLVLVFDHQNVDPLDTGTEELYGRCDS